MEFIDGMYCVFDLIDLFKEIIMNLFNEFNIVDIVVCYNELSGKGVDFKSFVKCGKVKLFE